MKDKTILITGAAGFIGASLAARLLEENAAKKVVAVDNMNRYYDVNIKRGRLKALREMARETGCPFEFLEKDIADGEAMEEVFAKREPDVVVNLAAQAGVRHSIDHPGDYISSNIVGFYNMAEACRRHEVGHFVFASSSSVYGGNEKIPFSEEDRVDHPVSLYAATKKSDELIAHTYAHLYKIPTTGLRFFTVYGPAGRPDMAYFKFADRLRAGGRIEIYNYGDCKRDFTYIDDIVEGVTRVMKRPPKGEVPYEIYNIGNSNPENLMDFVTILSEELIGAGALPEGFKIKEHYDLVPMQPGDVPVTYADTSKLERDFGFRPSTPLREGLRRFSRWYARYYNNEDIKSSSI